MIDSYKEKLSFDDALEMTLKNLIGQEFGNVRIKNAGVIK